VHNTRFDDIGDEPGILLQADIAARDADDDPVGMRITSVSAW
jgi:hypothetical protein